MARNAFILNFSAHPTKTLVSLTAVSFAVRINNKAIFAILYSMIKKTQKIRNVIVAANLADASWRDFLTGFFDYARTGVHWNIRLLQSAEELAREADDFIHADGIVSGIRANDATAAAFSATKIPLVLVGMEDERLTRRTGTTVIRNDNEDIGAFAARHFAAKSVQ